MRNLFLLGALALAYPASLLGSPTVSRAAPPSPVFLPQEPVAEEEHHGPIHEHMLLVRSEMKKLRRAIRKPETFAVAITSCLAAQAEVKACRPHVPPMAEAMLEGEDRDAFLAAFRTHLVEFEITLLQLEKALLASDVDQAKVLYAAAADFEDSGHEKFTQG